MVFINVTRDSFGGVATRDPSLELDASFLDVFLVDGKAGVVGLFVGRKDVLGDIDETASQITGVGGTKRGRDLALASASSRDEGLKGIKTFFVGTLNRELDFVVVNIDHDTNLGGGKLDVGNRATGAGVDHDSDIGIHIGEFTLEELGDLVVDVAPVGNGQIMTFFVGQETFFELVLDKSGLGVAFGDEILNFGISRVIVFGGTDARNRFVFESEVFNRVGDTDGLFSAVHIVDVGHDLLELFRSLNRVVVRVVLWENFVEDDAAERRLANFFLGKDANRGLEVD